MFNRFSGVGRGEVRIPPPLQLQVVRAYTLFASRTGYPAFVYDRSFILQSLYEHLWDNDKVLVNKRVQRIDHSRDCVKVICHDGTEYVGQIAVGSDGVNSVVRKEMWRLSDVDKPGRISQKEKNCQFADSIPRVGTGVTVSSSYSRLSRFVWNIKRRQRNRHWNYDCSLAQRSGLLLGLLNGR